MSTTTTTTVTDCDTIMVGESTSKSTSAAAAAAAAAAASSVEQKEPQEHVSVNHRHRTVNDFDDVEDDLRMALMNMDLRCRQDCEQERERDHHHQQQGDGDSMQDEPTATTTTATTTTSLDTRLQGRDDDTDETIIHNDWDWALTNYDVEHSEPQSVSQELQRLRTLQSYQIVGAEREDAFDRLCALGARVFQVPMTAFTLIDLGRQWLVSNHGMGDLRETSRKAAFCAHTIQYKDDIMVVPDCSQDARFCNEPCVNGQDGTLRFYAGAAMISPEGYKLGSFCVIDTQPRPHGLTAVERANLLDFAAMGIKALVDRRELKTKVHRDVSQLLASATHDLMAPLTGMKHTLTALQQDDALQQQLSEHHKQSLSTTVATADMMQQICETTLEALEQQQLGDNKDNSSSNSDSKEDKDQSQRPKTTSNRGSDHSPASATECSDTSASSSGVTKTTTTTTTRRRDLVDMSDHIRRLHKIIDPIPKQVPLIISVDPDVPLHILSDDLKMLRCSLNLLVDACSKTKYGKIQFRVFRRNDQLVFECEDTRNDSTQSMEEQAECLFGNCPTTSTTCTTNSSSSRLGDEMSQLALNSLALQVRALNGKFGYRSQKFASQRVYARGRVKEGAYFWFSIPIEEPHATQLPCLFENNGVDCSSFHDSTLSTTTTTASTTSTTSQMLPTPISPIELKNESGHDNNSERRVVQKGDQVVTGMPALPQLVREEHLQDIPTTSSGTRQRAALVIEDSVVVRKSIARALSKKGYDVVTAADGVEGLKALQERVFDVSFCDFVMPNKDGVDCVAEYRKWERTNRPGFTQYIIGMSAHANDNHVLKGLQAGMNEYHAKPMTTKVLTELCQGRMVQELSAFLDYVSCHKGQFRFPTKNNNVAERSSSAASRSSPSCAAVQNRSTNRSREVMEFANSSDGSQPQPQTPSTVFPPPDCDYRLRKRLKIDDLICMPQITTTGNS